jgi:hypothetical protein
MALVVVLLACWSNSLLFGEKVESWLEVRSPHFVLITNGPPKAARRVIYQFEIIRAVWQTTFPSTRVDPSLPLTILAVRDEEGLKALMP